VVGEEKNTNHGVDRVIYRTPAKAEKRPMTEYAVHVMAKMPKVFHHSARHYQGQKLYWALPVN